MDDGPSPDALPRAIRQAYEGAGLSQQALAAATGIDQSLLSKYARGAATPPLSVLPRIDTACGQPLGHVLRLAGYVADVISVETAVQSDPDLDPEDKGMLVRFYRRMKSHPLSSVGEQ